MNLMIGTSFELEVCVGSIFIRAGNFERFWNVYGLASH